jgi:sodium transport system ATP-binding protein
MIQVSDLKKVFKLSKKEIKKNKKKKTDQVIAVNGVSFSVASGEIYALLGPNGAGKTTTLRCLSTLIHPTQGKIVIGGFDSKIDSEKIREQISFLTNELKLDDHFTAEQTMKFFGELRNLSHQEIERKKEELFSRLDIKGFKDKRVGELSTGMKQKLGIAVSLLHDPEVIIFDEPTNGLDVLTARTITDYLLEMKQRGKTIIISTHVMRVAERLSDRIGILINGKLVSEGTLSEILDETEQETLDDAFFTLYGRYGENDG